MEQTTKYVGVDGGEYLLHFGILGMKWGVRRFQNPDGTLTEAGRRRYAKDFGKQYHKKLAEGGASAYRSAADYLNRMASDRDNSKLVKEENVKKAERDYYDAVDRKRALDEELSNETVRRFEKDHGRKFDPHNVEDIEEAWNKYDEDVANDRWADITKADNDVQSTNMRFAEELLRYRNGVHTTLDELSYGDKRTRGALLNAMDRIKFENGKWVLKDNIFGTEQGDPKERQKEALKRSEAAQRDLDNARTRYEAERAQERLNQAKEDYHRALYEERIAN